MTSKKENLSEKLPEIKPLTLFDKLYAVNCADKVEKKNGLSYLSWAWAWAEFKKLCPSAQYEVIKTDSGLPYVFDEKTGYMVYTRVTVDDQSYEMFLPVMDSANNAMKDKPYEITTKYKKITVAPATMFDINKTIMRCLVKNLAMFGLGLYIYAGEDLPEEIKAEATAEPDTKAPDTVKPPFAEATSKKLNTAPKKPNKARADFVDFCKENEINGLEFQTICKMFKLNNAAPDDNFTQALEYAETIAKKRAYAQSLAGDPDAEPEIAPDDVSGITEV